MRVALAATPDGARLFEIADISGILCPTSEVVVEGAMSDDGRPQVN